MCRDSWTVGLRVDRPAVGVIDRVDHRQQGQRFGDPPVLDEPLTERCRVSVAAEHPQQVVGADLVGDQRPDDAKHVGPMLDDLVQVDVVTGDRVERPVVGDRVAGPLRAPVPGVADVGDPRGEPVAQQAEHAEDNVRVRRLVGCDQVRSRASVEGQQHVQDVQAVAWGARHDLRADPGDLVVDGVEPGQPALVAEVLR